MNQKPNNLEAEFGRMQPAALPRDFAARIEAKLQDDDARPWADRFLLASISAGSMAACVIVTMLSMQTQLSPGSITPVNVAAISPKADDAPLAFARADSVWVETIK